LNFRHGIPENVDGGEMLDSADYNQYKSFPRS